jgi:hypothetical protein
LDLRRELSRSAHDRLAKALAPLRDDRDVSIVRDVHVHQGWVGHVAICLGGVYVIEPRRWRGSVRMRRGRLAHRGANAAIEQALDGATRIRRRLASSGIVRTVGAVVALTDATMPDGPMDLRAVEVVEAAVLPAWIRGRRPRLQPIELEAIREVLTPHDEIPWRP